MLGRGGDRTHRHLDRRARAEHANVGTHSARAARGVAQGTGMTVPNRPYTLWSVSHPEHFVRIEVPARSPEEARRVAWQRWYRRPVRTGLDELMRDAFDAQDTGKPVEQEPTPVWSGAKTSVP